MVVSGPTENAFYQIGRKLAGPEFSGEYHERGTAEIKRELARLARVRQIATLYWPAPLFEIFVGSSAVSVTTYQGDVYYIGWIFKPIFLD